VQEDLRAEVADKVFGQVVGKLAADQEANAEGAPFAGEFGEALTLGDAPSFVEADMAAGRVSPPRRRIDPTVIWSNWSSGMRPAASMMRRTVRSRRRAWQLKV
jgi:hypothetical protein